MPDGEMTDAELWEIAGKRGDYHPDVEKPLAHIEAQERRIATSARQLAAARRKAAADG